MTVSRPWFLLVALMIAAPVAAQVGPPKGGPHEGGPHEGGPHEGGPHEGGPHARPPAAIEFLAGHAGFADDATIEHSVFGGAGRIYVTPRLSVGPEITYMRGPREDRDWFFLGNLTFDILRPRAGRPRTVSPFLIAGGGLSTHSDQFLSGTFRSSEGAFVGGGGTRVHVTDHVYGMVDFRIGSDLYIGLRVGSG